MPYLNLKLCALQAPEMADTIANVLTDLTAEVLRKRREFTSVAVEYVPAAQWLIGGVSLASQDRATFYLEIKVTEGTNSKDEMAAYVDRVFSAMESLLGRLHPVSYIVIHEARADSWGYEGTTQEFRYIREKAV